MIISYSKSNINNNEIYNNLYKRCFKNFPQNKDINYLNWLYKKNPIGNFIGIDAIDNNNVVGQVGGIPQEFNFKGKKIKLLQSMNVCVDPNYRGRNLFTEMAIRLETYAKELGFTFIIAVANQSASYVWKKSINMKHLASLEALIGFGNLNLKKYKSNPNYFYQLWDEKILNWRINNPYNKIKVYNKGSKIFLKSTSINSLIKVFTSLENYDYQITYSKYELQFFPKIFLGLVPNIERKFFIKIPNLLKPSPLNFMYKDISVNQNKIEKNEVFFSYIDFDAY